MIHSYFGGAYTSLKTAYTWLRKGNPAAATSVFEDENLKNIEKSVKIVLTGDTTVGKSALIVNY